jgi:HEAT repeat protein
MILLTRLVGPKMVPFLMQALEDPDPRVRANAVESMGLLRDPKTIRILHPFLKDENHRIRANAIIALYPFTAIRKETQKALDQLYQSSLPMSRYAAIFAIGQLRLKKYQKDLLPLLHSKDQALILHVSSALGQMKNRAFCEPFLNLLRRDNEELAEEAAHRMGQLPRWSRYLIFEQITKLPRSERALIFRRFDTTPLDFSFEKDLMERRKLLPSQMRF